MAATRIISIIGRKNAGKTTLTVALASELARRGRRVMTIKHGHHPADVDRPGTRHLAALPRGPGRARRCIAAPDLRVLFERSRRRATTRSPWPAATCTDADIVLAEGFKAAPLPKIEVFRRGGRRPPLYDPARRERRRLGRHRHRRPRLRGAPARVLRFHDTIWLQLLATLRLGSLADRSSRDRAARGAAEAARRILDDVRRQPALRIPLDDALGSVLAEDVVSPLDIPAWTNSAMDGYAARGDDVAGRIGRASRFGSGWSSSCRQGTSPPDRIGPGECARIFTGAPLPEGADSVIRQEDTDEGADTVTIVERPRRRGQHPRGSARTSGRAATVLTAGAELGPAQLGVLASLAVAHPLVYRRPRVAILGSGDEIVDIDQPEEILSGRKIASSNTHTLVALVRQAGGEPVNLGIARDTPESLREHLGAGARLRSPGHHGRHQCGRARLRSSRARGARRRAALLEAADAARRAGWLRAARTRCRGSGCRATR